MVTGTTYAVTLYESGVGSSFDISRAYFTIGSSQDASLSVSAISATATNGGGYNDWRQYSFDYTAAGSDAGSALFLNLESSRDVSTAVSGWDDITVTATAIPEPSGFVLMTIAGLIVVVMRRSRRACGIDAAECSK